MGAIAKWILDINTYREESQYGTIAEFCYFSFVNQYIVNGFRFSLLIAIQMIEWLRVKKRHGKGPFFILSHSILVCRKCTHGYVVVNRYNFEFKHFKNIHIESYYLVNTHPLG